MKQGVRAQKLGGEKPKRVQMNKVKIACVVEEAKQKGMQSLREHLGCPCWMCFDEN